MRQLWLELFGILPSRRNVSTGAFLNMSAYRNYATCKSYAKEIHLHAVSFRLAMNPTKIPCQIPQKSRCLAAAFNELIVSVRRNTDILSKPSERIFLRPSIYLV